MQGINHVISKLNGCIKQVELMNPSGASNQDIMNQANELLMQDPKYSSGFKFDHVWPIMKDFTKLGSTSRRRNTHQSSSQSDASVPESPVLSSPGVSSFNINLSDDNDGGSSSSMRSDGVKKI